MVVEAGVEVGRAGNLPGSGEAVEGLATAAQARAGTRVERVGSGKVAGAALGAEAGTAAVAEAGTRPGELALMERGTEPRAAVAGGEWAGAGEEAEAGTTAKKSPAPAAAVGTPPRRLRRWRGRVGEYAAAATAAGAAAAADAAATAASAAAAGPTRRSLSLLSTRGPGSSPV